MTLIALPCYSQLCEAKRGCLLEAGVGDPSHSAVLKAITREELARHCRRQTRGAEVTLQLIEELLLAFGTATDSYGVLLFGDQMVTIWEEQKHIPCIQDPLEVTLYTITGYTNKGGVRLPVYRCVQGTTSLESFHLHLARYVCMYAKECYCKKTILWIHRFIPGSSASDVHFQMYLLEGLSRWNQAHRLAAVQQQSKHVRTFNLELACKVSAQHCYKDYCKCARSTNSALLSMTLGCSLTTMPQQATMKWSALGWIICSTKLVNCFPSRTCMRQVVMMMMIVDRMRVSLIRVPMIHSFKNKTC